MKNENSSIGVQQANDVYRRAIRLMTFSIIGWMLILITLTGLVFLACEESSVTELVASIIANKEMRIEGKDPSKTIITPGSVVVIGADGAKAVLNTTGLKFYNSEGIEIQRHVIPHMDLPKQ